MQRGTKRRRTRTGGWALLGFTLALAALSRRRRLDLRGRIVLITGGSRGLGLRLAHAFGRAGARLALAARSGPALEEARQELAAAGVEAVAIACDVSNPAQVEALVREAQARLGPIDVLVNVAGIMTVGPAERFSLDDLRSAVSIDFWGIVHPALAVLPAMRQRGEGAIVNITSIGGAVAVPHLLPYSAAKFGAVGFSEGLAAEVRRHGIRVTTVLPGLMRTGSFGNALFKGDREAEVTWFSIAASLPLLTVSADRAARRILRACERGERFLVIGWPARALRLIHALLPGTTIRALELANRWALPAPRGAGPEQSPSPGRAHRRGWARSLATALGDRAARRNREHPAGA